MNAAFDRKHDERDQEAAELMATEKELSVSGDDDILLASFWISPYSPDRVYEAIEEEEYKTA